MQVIIQHWGEVTLQSSSKRKNASIIEEFTGIKKYDAHSDQRARMMQMIDRDNYLIMLERVSKMPLDDERIGSSNFDIFMGYLSKGDHNWIDEINKAIET